MNWFKKLFKTDQLSKDIGKVILPAVENSLPMPEVLYLPPEYLVEDATADKDISEPILSFVKCVENNPKRFEVTKYYTRPKFIKLNIDIHRPYQYWAFVILDKEINRGWYIKGQFFYWGEEKLYKNCEEADFLTTDEEYYLISAISKVFATRENKYNQLINIRKERDKIAKRNILKEIYK